MSRTHYTSHAEIEARIDLFTAKRDRMLKLAEWIECGAKWLRGQALEESLHGEVSLSAAAADDEAKKFRSAAKHEDEVTLPKLKAKLAEMQTAPIPGVGEISVSRK